jgi:hypothetical protein
MHAKSRGADHYACLGSRSNGGLSTGCCSLTSSGPITQPGGFACRLPVTFTRRLAIAFARRVAGGGRPHTRDH